MILAGFRETLSGEPSPKRKALHLILGAALPLACLYFDPIVFKTSDLLDGPGGAFLGAFRMAGHTAAAIAVTVLTRACFTRITAIETGLLYGAAAVAFALGVLMVPISIIGLMVLVGVLGFSPFASAWVYLRYAARQRGMRRAPVLAGLVLFLGFPALAQLGVNQAIGRAIATGKPAMAVLRPLYDANLVLDRYSLSTSSEEKQRLSIVYRSLTGKSAEEQLALWGD